MTQINPDRTTGTIAIANFGKQIFVGLPGDTR